MSPIPEGMRLYQSLAKTGSVVLLGTGPADQHTLDWLDLHGCVHHDFVGGGRKRTRTRVSIR